MYTDETMLTYGKYKFYRLREIPAQYFLTIWENGGGGNKDLLQWIESNLERIKALKDQKVQPTVFVPFTCDKRTFATKKDAKESLSKIRQSKGDHIKPMRAYECEKCGGWHLTSMPIELFKEIKS